jgi:hypothetical protein
MATEPEVLDSLPTGDETTDFDKVLARVFSLARQSASTHPWNAPND